MFGAYFFDSLTADSYSHHGKEAPLWAVAVRTVLRRHRDLLEPLLLPFADTSPSAVAKHPPGWDFYLEIPFKSMSNGENPVFLIGKLPRRQMRLTDGTIADAPTLPESSDVDYANLPTGAQLVPIEAESPSGALVLKFFSASQSSTSHHCEIAAHMMFTCLAKDRPLPFNATAPKESAEYIFNHTPKILVHDRLYDFKHRDVRDYKPYAEPRGWPYLIMPFVHGQDLNQLFPHKTSSAELHELDGSAKYLGRYLQHLHQFQVGTSLKKSYNPLYQRGWRTFESWLVKQRRVAVHDRPIDHESTLPHLRSQLDDYLPRDVRTLIEWYRETFDLTLPRLLHNDLNEENLFLLDGKPSAILDFGDCGLGDPQYDWVAVFVSSLRCCKRLLTTALMEYYQLSSFDELTQKVGGWKRFTYTMMCYGLLHEQDAMRSVYYRRPSLRNIHTLEALADEIWNLSIPQSITNEQSDSFESKSCSSP